MLPSPSLSPQALERQKVLHALQCMGRRILHQRFAKQAKRIIGLLDGQLVEERVAAGAM
jgi:hypothetical protein